MLSVITLSVYIRKVKKRFPYNPLAGTVTPDQVDLIRRGIRDESCQSSWGLTKGLAQYLEFIPRTPIDPQDYK